MFVKSIERRPPRLSAADLRVFFEEPVYCRYFQAVPHFGTENYGSGVNIRAN